MPKKTLAEILAENDELGLLSNLKPVGTGAGSEEQRVRQKFEEINVFFDRYGRAPGDVPATQKASPSEKMMQFALNGMRNDDNVVAALLPYDRHNLFAGREPPAAPATSLDDIIASDDDLLTTPADEIFTFNRAPAPKARSDRKSERRPCESFASFKLMFDECATQLRSGARKTRRFANEQEIKAGEFFILNGQMVYVAEVNDRHIRNGKPNARLRLIFDNGTEGENLLRSLSAELYKDQNGRRITALGSDAGPLFEQDAPVTRGFSEENLQTGEIYIARSLSNSPEIRKLDGHLFKIGFTTGSTEARIATAKDDPTFLLAPAHPVKVFVVYNMNTVKMENLLHRFFGEARLNIEIMDRFGKPFRPREWFLVPLPVVERAVAMLIEGTIVGHRYDQRLGSIVPNHN